MTPAPITHRAIPKTATAMPTVTIYGPELCPNCDQLKGQLGRAGVPYTKVDLEVGDENYLYVTQTLGYQEAPVVVVQLADAPNAEPLHWGGKRMDMSTALIRMAKTVPAAAADENAA
jgi:glutaredoxin-like protein NrdH